MDSQIRFYRSMEAYRILREATHRTFRERLLLAIPIRRWKEWRAKLSVLRKRKAQFLDPPPGHESTSPERG